MRCDEICFDEIRYDAIRFDSIGYGCGCAAVRMRYDMMR